MTPSHHARGMTLLEVLLAVALLSFLSAGTLWLVTLATREAPALSNQLRWQVCAERTLDLITDALLIGDSSAGRTDKLRLHEDTLFINTRVVNDDSREVSLFLVVNLDRRAEELRMNSNSGSAALASRSPTLLGKVADWTIHIDPPTRTLSVSVRHPLGWTVQRSGRW